MTTAPFSWFLCRVIIRDAGEPYLGLLWEASESEGSLPHPLLMGPEHLDLLQVWHESLSRANRRMPPSHLCTNCVKTALKLRSRASQ